MTAMVDDDHESTPTLIFDEIPASGSSWVLRVVAGPDAGIARTLNGSLFAVGKNDDCDLVLTDSSISRRHLELRVGREGVIVRDVGSTNGAYYHGIRFREVVVRARAEISLGQTRLALSRALPVGMAGIEPPQAFAGLIGRSAQMQSLFAMLARIAPTSSTVLIEGETGTGKELCARAVHAASNRSSGPLMVCDLAGIPRTLLESEIFGHVRGAFTGATSDRVGAFELADGGTLFLDEIGELDLELQPRLLRAIEERAVRRVGASHYRDVDVRIVAATNKDLAQEVTAGRFRSDLFHRLAVVRLRISPLRERKEDIPLLVERFLAKTDSETSPSARALLEQHDWPGNVRELRNVIESACALAGPGTILEPSALGLDEDAGATRVRGTSPDPFSYHDEKRRIIEAWERGYVESVLAETGGNVSEAARRCGLGRAYLHRLIRKYRLQS